MAAAGGSEAAAAAGGRRGPLGIPEAAFVVSGAGGRGWATPSCCSWRAGPASGAGHPRGGVRGERGRGAGAPLRRPGPAPWGGSAAGSRSGRAREGRGWRRPCRASVLGPFRGRAGVSERYAPLQELSSPLSGIEPLPCPSQGSELGEPSWHTLQHLSLHLPLFIKFYTAERIHSSEAPMCSWKSANVCLLENRPNLFIQL